MNTGKKILCDLAELTRDVVTGLVELTRFLYARLKTLCEKHGD